jgi:two-component system chemotaxis response regulator CheB
MQKLIVIGASAGGVNALTNVTAALPADLAATVLIVMHIGARRSLLPEILQKLCPLPVKHAEDGILLENGEVLIAPPDRHLTVEMSQGKARARLWHGPKENYTRPAIDPLFRSAAVAFDGHVIGVVLTGYLDDGTAGLQAVKACGGYAIVQDPADAEIPEMPASVLSYVAVDQVLPLGEIAPLLASLAQMPVRMNDKKRSIPELIQMEHRYIEGTAGLDDIERIGSRSAYTCPECSGALWRINGATPSRFRCHTGHGFSFRTLMELQEQAVEEALWSSLRALQEKLRMEQESVQDAVDRRDVESEEIHLLYMQKLQSDIDTLKKLLARP